MYIFCVFVRLGDSCKDKMPSSKKAPYFNSPSIPSFRLLEDEDDLGNYIEDPNLRRPVGPFNVCVTHHTVQCLCIYFVFNN